MVAKPLTPHPEVSGMAMHRLYMTAPLKVEQYKKRPSKKIEVAFWV
jgi:hypothetical protein